MPIQSRPSQSKFSQGRSSEPCQSVSEAKPVVAAGGRRASISRAELIDAALALLGPHRSVSTLSLREVAREAGIAPNSFYRHFRDVDELAIALIEQAGSELRSIIGNARQRASRERSVVQTSLEVFAEQLQAEQGYLQLLLREGKVGSAAFKQAVEQQLIFFENELREDLIRLEQQHGHQLHAPDIVAKAITRLVFAMGACAMEAGQPAQQLVLQQTVSMVHMLIYGARIMASDPAQQPSSARPAMPVVAALTGSVPPAHARP